MNHINKCNFCRLEEIRAKAISKGEKVTVLNAKGPLKGKDVFMSPQNVEIKGDSNNDDYFLIWFLDIGKECSCLDD